MLLRAAQASFAQSGFKATSIREIAQAAGVHHALVIHRFGSKEELWRAVMDRLQTYLEPFLHDLRRYNEASQPAIEERLKAAFRILAAAVCGEPDCGLLLSRIATERGAAFDFLVEKLLRPFHDAFFPLLKDAMDAGIVARQDPEMLYFMVFNMVVTSVSHRHILSFFEERPRDLKKLQEDIVQLMELNIIHPKTREV